MVLLAITQPHQISYRLSDLDVRWGVRMSACLSRAQNSRSWLHPVPAAVFLWKATEDKHVQAKQSKGMASLYML